ncbi:MAG: tRNA pseudouridine(13) synthase TruD [Phycisphaerales bacterium]
MSEPTAWLTRELPGIGGVIKQRPSDFIVEELPLYEPCGEGEHLYLFIEKREMDTPELVDLMAEHFGVPRFRVGVAGRKDRLAVSRQLVSVHLPGRSEAEFGMLRDERAAVLWVDRHTNKLRTGHLAGNRFNLRIRGVQMSDALPAQRILRMLSQRGVPNAFGPQRFGADGRNAEIGLQLLSGTLRRRMPAEKRRFYLNALQSLVFNRVLHHRVLANELSTIVAGDLAWVHERGAVFAADEADAAENALRCERFEISPSGPLWGPTMTQPSGRVLKTELDALATVGLTPGELASARDARLIPGARRPLRVPLSDPEVEGGIDEHGAYVRIAFDLPAGSYATAVLGEVMKAETREAAR